MCDSNNVQEVIGWLTKGDQKTEIIEALKKSTFAPGIVFNPSEHDQKIKHLVSLQAIKTILSLPADNDDIGAAQEKLRENIRGLSIYSLKFSKLRPSLELGELTLPKSPYIHQAGRYQVYFFLPNGRDDVRLLWACRSPQDPRFDLCGTGAEEKAILEHVFLSSVA